ncbi:DUF3861 family protein [Xanthomonas sp. AmX2]|uniref:DUF3861 family protein n=1 Tax=Xanthomonas sp. TaxID=29446 RepID=UPI00197D6DBB|nr:DUF3861 family protein [Xanthomonas sp.]MBN6149473.1 DUF3861 family protein [Xanthomonas sp.]
MSSSRQRYRITVTPIEADGLQCRGRCTIEFEARCQSDWMRLLEAAQRQPGLSGDERAALTVGTQLLQGLAQRSEGDAQALLAPLRPTLDAILARLQSAA